MQLGFNFSAGDWTSTSTSAKPVVSVKYGSAFCSVTRVDVGKWRIDFDPSISLTSPVVYLYVQYTYGSNEAGSTAIGSLAVNAVDSSVPIYQSTEARLSRSGSGSLYYSFRGERVICNSSSYYITVGDPTSNCSVYVYAFCTSVIDPVQYY